jgi:hypothetical protein
MADYSRFGCESLDWTEYMRLNPPHPMPEDLSPLQLQQITNEGREANSRAILKDITGKPAKKVGVCRNVD